MIIKVIYLVVALLMFGTSCKEKNRSKKKAPEVEIEADLHKPINFEIKMASNKIDDLSWRPINDKNHKIKVLERDLGLILTEGDEKVKMQIIPMQVGNFSIDFFDDGKLQKKKIFEIEIEVNDDRSSRIKRQQAFELDADTVEDAGSNNRDPSNIGEGSASKNRDPSDTVGPLLDPAEAATKTPTGKKHKTISLGQHHSCVVLENGDVKCWGFNNSGQLGTGDTPRLNIPSAPINLGGKAKAIALGDNHSCAVLENGEVKCWGWNSSGQLGTGNTTSLNIPSAPINLGGKAVNFSWKSSQLRIT